MTEYLVVNLLELMAKKSKYSDWRSPRTVVINKRKIQLPFENVTGSVTPTKEVDENGKERTVVVVNQIKYTQRIQNFIKDLVDELSSAETECDKEKILRDLSNQVDEDLKKKGNWLCGFGSETDDSYKKALLAKGYYRVSQ